VSEAVICEPIRTPVGGFGGSLRDVKVQELGATVIRELVRRTGITGDQIDDVVFGHCYPTMDAPAIGRVAALDAGLDVNVPGLQIDRRCGSGLQAVLYAAMSVATGGASLVLAGGAESMSGASYFTDAVRWGTKAGGFEMKDSLAQGRVWAGGVNHPVKGGMIETAENVRKRYSIPRDEQDRLAVRSHEKATAAVKEGRYADELVPVTIHGRKGDTVVEHDEHIRPDASIESLGKLRPIMGKQDPDATVTAGNASGQNDGAAVCLVTTPEKAESLGLRPLARLVSWGVGAVGPEVMGIGPVPATEQALGQAGLSLADMDVIELNEAFAAQALGVGREWGIDLISDERVNPNGSGISLGHPVGATGVRILATMLREMDRREARYGLETMCIGGGQGLAAVFERVG
jgi:acetyl-CoA C-acetyltransferase